MNCREVWKVADAFGDEDVADTHYEVLQHFDACPACRAEIEARRRLRGALRTAFHRAPDLQPTDEFLARVRDGVR